MHLIKYPLIIYPHEMVENLIYFVTILVILPSHIYPRFDRRSSENGILHFCIEIFIVKKAALYLEESIFIKDLLMNIGREERKIFCLH